jgi:hypothetical protein
MSANTAAVPPIEIKARYLTDMARAVAALADKPGSSEEAVAALVRRARESAPKPPSPLD